jgi:phosphoribosylglycinamide formyltransferase 1
LRLVILASGSGSTFQAIVEAEAKNQLSTKTIALIVDRESQALARAKNFDIPSYHINYKSDPSTFSQRLTTQLSELNPDCVLLCGFLRKIPVEVIEKFKGRIFNTHPSLLPRHGGAGLYGSKVHAAVINSKDQETGITFHHVTENYDEGPAVAQKKILVSADDTAQTLEEKVKAVEKEFIIEQLKKISIR